MGGFVRGGVCKMLDLVGGGLSQDINRFGLPSASTGWCDLNGKSSRGEVFAVQLHRSVGLRQSEVTLTRNMKFSPIGLAKNTLSRNRMRKSNTHMAMLCELALPVLPRNTGRKLSFCMRIISFSSC